MPYDLASVVQSAKPIVSSMVQGAKPIISTVVQAAKPVVESAAEAARPVVWSIVQKAKPLMARLDTLRLKSPDPRMRRKAVEHLSESTRPSDTELIFASLNDTNPQVRCAAVRALAKTRTPESLRSLTGALQDPSYQVREASARALGRLGDADSVKALAACLRDPDASVRIAVAGALRSLGWRPSTREELAWFEITLGNTPAATVNDNGSRRQDTGYNPDNRYDTSFYRRVAEEELKAGTSPARIKSLRAALRGNDLLARTSAVHDLAQINGPEITEELLRLFRHPDAETRLAAATALAGREDAPPGHFLSLLKDTSVDVRLTAVQFLARIHNEQIAVVLFPLMSDPNMQVRRAAVTAIGQIRNHCRIASDPLA